MSEPLPDGRTPRRIVDVSEAGCANAGCDIRLNLRFVDDSKERFDIPHDRIGKIITALFFGAAVAKEHRPIATPAGNPLPELTSVIDQVLFDVASFPGADFVALHVVIASGVSLTFRVPLRDLPALQARLQSAAVLAQSGTSSAPH